MNPDQLQREVTARRRMAPVAVVAALLLVVAAITGIVGTHANVDEETLALIMVHKRFPLDLIGAVLNAVGLVSLGLVVNFLWGATKARRPMLSPAFRYLALGGSVLAAVAAIVYEALIAVAAHKFVTTGQQTYSQAHHLTNTVAILALPTAAFAGDFLLALSLVMISLNAMRAGLLPKAMGYLGIAVGILFLFPIFSPVPVIQAGWLAALAYLFYGRWPNEYPPAWDRGEAVPWPAAQKAPRASSSAPARGSRAKPRPAPAPEAVAAPTARATRATTPKRKRKRRH